MGRGGAGQEIERKEIDAQRPKKQQQKKHILIIKKYNKSMYDKKKQPSCRT